MSDLDTLIIESLQDADRPLKSSQIRIDVQERSDQKYSERTVRSHIYSLEKKGVVKCVLAEDKNPAYLLASKYKEWSEIKFQERKIHSDELKKVIELWLEQFPVVAEYNKIEIHGLIFPTSTLGWGSFPDWSGTIPVESHDLFQDLKNHVEPIVFSNWDSLKNIAKNLQTRRDSVLARLQKKVQDMMGLPVSIDWTNNVVRQVLLATLFRSLARSLILKEYPRRFEEDWKDLKSRSETKEHEDSIEYWLDGIGYVKVSKGAETKEQFKERVNGLIEQIVEEAKNYCKRIKDIQRLAEQFQTLVDETKSILTKDLRRPVLPGPCEYL